MKQYIIKDEKLRESRFYFKRGEPETIIINKLSYYYCRTLLKEMEEVMGLDKLVERKEELNESNNK